MTTVDNHLPPAKASPRVSVVGATERFGEDHHLDEGKYRRSRDYPLDDFAYLEFAEVEETAHNAAYYDAAEALDMK